MGAQPDTLTSTPEVWHGVPQILAQVSVAAHLATYLVRRYLSKGATVLDPFCGSGRLLAAAESASVRVGVDANPLAWLLTMAKLSNSAPEAVGNIADDLALAKRTAPAGVRL